MLHGLFEEGDWFAPKAYGYGSGLPIAWQGWVVLLGYIAFLALLGGLVWIDGSIGPAIAFALFLPVTIWFTIVVQRRTRGGWKWRWGQWD